MFTRHFIYALLIAFAFNGGAYAFENVNVNTRIDNVIRNPAFKNFGRLIFPANEYYYSGETLGDLRLTWYSNVKPSRTVDIVRYMLGEVQEGRQIFYPIYPADDPRAKDTGLFFFRGKAGARFAVCNAGGGFVFVGAMHDSFPHALELSRLGYNAFALIYRPGADTACEDLARAIAFIHEHADELGVDVKGYSLWGGSAGARMAAWLGTYGTDAMIEVFPGLSHGFGLGEGTVAESWLNNAVKFWEKHM